MRFHYLTAIFLGTMLLSTGCLDSLTNSEDAGKFWGDDCNEVSDDICPPGKAPDFSLVDQYGNVVNVNLVKKRGTEKKLGDMYE